LGKSIERNIYMSGSLTVLLLGVALISFGCSPNDTWMRAQGYTKRTCDESEYVVVRAQNQISAKIEFGLCSPDVKLKPKQNSLPPNSNIQELRITTASKSATEWIASTDTCETKSMRPHEVGELVPHLSPQDQARFQICLGSNYLADPQYTYTKKLYIFVLKEQPCPANSSVFDPSQVDCKIY